MRKLIDYRQIERKFRERQDAEARAKREQESESGQNGSGDVQVQGRNAQDRKEQQASDITQAGDSDRS